MDAIFSADDVARVRKHLHRNNPTRTAYQRAIHERFLSALTSLRDVHVVAPRRFGKTTAVQMFVDAVLATTRAQVAIVTPVSDRGAQVIRSGVRSDHAADRLIIAPHADADALRTASAAKVIIFDEAASLSDTLVKEYMLPLMGVANTVILATSTPLGQGPYADMLARKTPEGAPLCEIVTPGDDPFAVSSRQ